MKKKVLCIIHICDPEGRTLDQALQRADENTQLFIAGICDAREEELLSSQMSDRSFVGLRQREEITAFTCMRAEEATKELLDRAVARCKEQGFDAEGLSRSGGFLELVHDLSSEIQPSEILMPRLEQGLFSKLWRGNRTEAIVRSLRYRVTVC